MLGHIVWRRVISAVPVLIIVSIFAFSLQKMIPGDIADILLGDIGTEEQRQEIRIKYGLDQSLLVQYGRWAGGMVRGDWGTSYRSGDSVLSLILQKLRVTVDLAACAMVIATVLGITLGALAAVRVGKTSDHLINGIAIAGISVPSCLVSGFDGASFSSESKDALWARFYTAAPLRQRQSVEQYKIVKRA